jgi:uncharacterized membrane protein YphA (DoxX/SURF4 family)
MATVQSQKTQQIAYWIGILLTSLWFTASGFFEITRNPVVWDKTIALGYPPHFIIVLGIAKLAGVVVLLIPNKVLWLKEWVFAGLFFDIIFAFTSGYSVVGFSECIAPIVAFVMVLTTYILFRKIHPVFGIGL